MKISRSDAITICASLGFGTASKWDKPRMLKKLAEIQDMGVDLVIDSNGFEDSGEYNRICDLFEKIINIREQVEVISDKKYKQLYDNLEGDSDEVEDEEEGDQEEESKEVSEEEEVEDEEDMGEQKELENRELGESEEEEEDEEEAKDEEVDGEDEEEEEGPQEEIIKPKEIIDWVVIAKKADDGDEAAVKYLGDEAEKKNITPSNYTTWAKVAKAIATGVTEEASTVTYRARKYELRRKTIKSPEIPRNTKSRTFLAGQILREHGMVPITVEMVEELMKRYGDENYRACRTMLLTAYHIISGYLGKDLIEG